MSVEKMEKYKEYKKHRKAIIAKEKRRQRLNRVLGIIACVVVLGGIGFWVYRDVKPKEAATTPKTRSLINWDQYVPAEALQSKKEETKDASASTAEEAPTEASSSAATEAEGSQK